MPIIEAEFVELTSLLDVDGFWHENAACQDFTPRKPRCALSFSPDDHWLLEFTQAPSTLRYYRDKAYRDQLHREVNQVTQSYVGRAFFEEDTWVHSPKRIENLFGSEFVYTEGGTPWLAHVTEDPDAFARVLDRAEATDLKTWALPEEYRREWEDRKARGRLMPALGTGSRGPATIMTSVLPTETVFFWLYDYPDLMRRFRDVLAAKMVELNQVLREFSGSTSAGWWITDDNCALFNGELYREFCVPVLEVDVALIRKKMPEAMILGHTPPFLLRNGTPEAIRARVSEDFAKAGATGGLLVTTSGSLAAGTGVGRMRWYMQVTQEHCRYT